jgi:hypothetical protein
MNISMTSLMQERLARWQDRLQNLTVSPLTRDYPEPSHTESEKRPIEAFQSLELSPKTQDALQQLQITDGAKPHSSFTILLTALIVLVSRLTGDENISLGTSGEKGRPFVIRTAVDASESFDKLLAKVEKVGRTERSDCASSIAKKSRRLKNSPRTLCLWTSYLHTCRPYSNQRSNLFCTDLLSTMLPMHLLKSISHQRTTVRTSSFTLPAKLLLME